jgi:hypothetical protein
MQIKKDGMPKLGIFTDVSASHFGLEFVASYSKLWEKEAHFQAANAAAYLYRMFRDQGLAFFPTHIHHQIIAHGWNEREDHPVMEGEE